MKHEILDFYENSRGRLELNHREVMKYSDHILESKHDYIQWLFPLDAPSRFYPGIPLATQETIEVFRDSYILQWKMCKSLSLMRKFYGENNHWKRKGNHNFLRITRILKSLMLFELEIEAEWFLSWLKDQDIGPEILGRSMRFWNGALNENSE